MEEKLLEEEGGRRLAFVDRKEAFGDWDDNNSDDNDVGVVGGSLALRINAEDRRCLEAVPAILGRANMGICMIGV